MGLPAKRVNFVTNPDDAECYVGACAGLYSRAIGNKTGLTAGQAQYRIHASGGSAERRAWREGRSPWVGAFLKVVGPDVREHLEKVVVKELAHQKALQAKAKARAKARK